MKPRRIFFLALGVVLLIFSVLLLLAGLYPLTIITVKNDGDERRTVNVCISDDCQVVHLDPGERFWRVQRNESDSTVGIEGDDNCERYLSAKSFALCMINLNGECRLSMIDYPFLMFFLWALLSFLLAIIALRLSLARSSK